MAYLQCCFIFLVCRSKTALSKSDTTIQKLDSSNNLLSEELSSSKAEIQEKQLTMPLEFKTHDRALVYSLPASFDPRQKWPSCPTLNDIRDQGTCGSCWDVGSVAAITDRYCTVAKIQFYASADDALACSGGGNCQQGGDEEMVYKYWKHHGIASGGPNGCRPYRVSSCPDHRIGKPCPISSYFEAPTPRCERFCVGGYNKSYGDDLQMATEVYKITGEDNIKAELYLNGPVTAAMDVYEDFLTYNCGIYSHKNGSHMYAHTFKLLGWGEEEGAKYWLAANSWNVEWGEKGFFKILRGNKTIIDNTVVAGMPRL